MIGLDREYLLNMVNDESGSNGAEHVLPRLKTLRIGARLSINKLASEAGVSRDLVSSLERNHAHTLLKVQAVFDTLKKYHPELEVKKEIRRLKA